MSPQGINKGINKPGDIFKYLGESVNVEYDNYPKLNEFFNTINKAKKELEKLLPVTCELCGKSSGECECEDPFI